MKQKLMTQKVTGKPLNIDMVPTVHHWPNLKTVLMVEKILSEADLTMSLEQLKRKLPKKVMDQTLRLILLYLEENGKIYIGEKGITWIYNPSPKLERAMREGIEV